MSIAPERFPFTDIPEDLAECMNIYGLNRELFDSYHAIIERDQGLFRYGHIALRKGATAVLQDIELAEAVSIGVQAYEVIGGGIVHDVTMTEKGHAIAIENTRRFLDPTNLEQFRERGQLQAERMRQNMPRLHATVGEVASRHLSHNRTAKDYAIVGAAMLQGMHMRTERLAVG